MYKLLIIILFFSTTCLSQSILWEERFDPATFVSNGWTIINNDTSAGVPEIFGPFKFVESVRQEAQEGNYFFKFSFDDANYKNYVDDWLITPRLMNIEQGDSISFWCGAVDEQYKDSLRIWISTTDTLLNSFEMIDHFKVDGPKGAWHKKSYGLSKYAGKNILLAINYHLSNAGPLGSSSDNLWVDHFTLKGNALSGNVPESFMLRQNFPNPFNPRTEITFSVPERSNVTIRIYDALGKEVAVPVNGIYEGGNYNITIDGSNFASGVYFYKMIAGSFQDTKKMDLVK